METPFLQSWQFWLQILSLVGTSILMAFNWFSHNKIVGNDLHHLSADVKAIANEQEKQGGKIAKVAEDVAYLKGRDSVRQKVYTKKKLRTK